MPHRKGTAIEEPPPVADAAITVTCTTCGAQVGAVDIADHVCDDVAVQPIDETILDPTPHAVPTTAPAGVWAPWLIDKLEELAADGIATHAIIVFPDDQPPFAADVSDSADSALKQAGALAENGLYSCELRVFAIDALRAAAGRQDYDETLGESVIDVDQVVADAAEELGIVDVADAVLDEATAQIAAAAGITDSVEEARELLADEEHPEEHDGQKQIVDPDVYDDPRLVLNTKDGRRIHEISLGFGGGVALYRNTPGDLDLFKGLKLGQEVEFTITGVVVAETETEKAATKSRGPILTARKTIKVHSLEVA